MKKIILTVVMGFMAVTIAFAQIGGNGSGVSIQNTNHAGGVWVKSTNGVSLDICDIITIDNTSADNISTCFCTVADLQGPKSVGTAHFNIQSNRVFDVTAKASSDKFTATNIDAGIYGNVTGDETSMPADVLQMAVTAHSVNSGTLGLYFSPLGSYKAVPNTATGYTAYALGNGAGPSGDYGPLLLLDGKPGGFNTSLGTVARSFDVAYKANPGWAYAGGTYKLNVVYTAAQE